MQALLVQLLWYFNTMPLLPQVELELCLKQSCNMNCIAPSQIFEKYVCTVPSAVGGMFQGNDILSIVFNLHVARTVWVCVF